MSFIQNFFTSRDNNANTETYVGQTDRLWYNPDTNSIRVSDGSTPGGLVVDLETNANATFNSITANTGTINGNLIVTGNISPATANTIGGIYPGPGVVISEQGELTIDTANLPLSFGNFTANNNVLSIVNFDEDMVLATEGNAEIQLVGNIGFYKTDGIPPDVSNRYFSATDDGQITILVPEADPTSGAVKIIGSSTGNIQAPIVSGTMLHITGQNDTISRVYNDSIENYSVWIGRRYNGNASAPTPVLAGQSITRFGATTYTSANTFTPLGVARFDFIALEDQTATAQGAKVVLSMSAIGGNTPVIASTWTAADGMIGNVKGLLTRSSRDAGTIADGGTLAVNITTDDIVYCVWNNGMTVTYSNIVPGRVIKILATKGSGSGTDNITLDSGVDVTHTSTGSLTVASTSDKTVFLEIISTSTTASGIYINIS